MADSPGVGLVEFGFGDVTVVLGMELGLFLQLDPG